MPTGDAAREASQATASAVAWVACITILHERATMRSSEPVSKVTTSLVELSHGRYEIEEVAREREGSDPGEVRRERE